MWCLLHISSLLKESWERIIWKSDVFIDDDYDDYDDAFDGDGNNPDVVTYVELEVQITQYTKAKWHVLSAHLQIIQADDLK